SSHPFVKGLIPLDNLALTLRCRSDSRQKLRSIRSNISKTYHHKSQRATVVATDQIQVSGSDPQGNSSGIAAQVNSGATGNAGNLTLETGELLVSQGGQIGVSTFGEGNGGELKVNASQIELNGRNLKG
ncbi:MAG: hypothetical protein RID09_00060, partial [Coleofasciculus sp. G1-WW12-02]